MIIGIDISSIPYGTGVSLYTLNLVRSLLKIDKTNQYKLFFSSFRQPLPPEIKLLEKYPNVKIYKYIIPPTLLEFVWNQLHLFPIEFFIGKCDVFHTWDWTQPPTSKAKTVTTIHDFVPFLYPETQHSKTVSVFKRKLFWAKQECSHLICVSQNTYNDLIRLFPEISPAKVSVVYEAAEIKYDQFAKLPLLEKKQKKIQMFQQYGLSKYLLAQGTREPRKNLDRLIQAFIAYKKTNPHSKLELAISGKYGWGQDISNPKDNSIKILGYIPEKDMVALHAFATCLVYPSLYEGFGLPIIKSFKVGTPVITSNISSMVEIAGKAAVLVDPLDVVQITLAIKKVVSSSSFRHQLIARGYRQANKFSWISTARQTLAIYNKL